MHLKNLWQVLLVSFYFSLCPHFQTSVLLNTYQHLHQMHPQSLLPNHAPAQQGVLCSLLTLSLKTFEGSALRWLTGDVAFYNCSPNKLLFPYPKTNGSKQDKPWGVIIKTKWDSTCKGARTELGALHETQYTTILHFSLLTENKKDFAIFFNGTEVFFFNFFFF